MKAECMECVAPMTITKIERHQDYDFYRFECEVCKKRILVST